MLQRRFLLALAGERGDTLIEVTFALAILSFVLLGSTSIAAAAFRTGQTARERTQVAEAAQEQMEALRSFRDNHTWPEFRNGAGGSYLGIDGALSASCAILPVDSGKQCFHMVNASTGSATEWVPAAGPLAASPGNVPTSMIEITTNTPGGLRDCGYDFQLQYAFTELGGGQASNNIGTRLVNLKYDPNGAPSCP